MKLYLFVCILLAASCKKSTDPISKLANNNISLRVYSSTGVLSTYNYHGAMAFMSHYTLNGEFYGEGKLHSNYAQLVFWADNINPAKVNCTFSPGDGYSKTYYTPSIDPGTISFTRHADQYAEGTFSAKCGYLADTITIQGTFSGYYP